MTIPMMDSTLALGPQSRALLALDFADGAIWEPSTGQLVARSGQRFTFDRGGATLASVDATGGTYTAPASMPAWELANSVLGIRMGTGDIVREASVTNWVPSQIKSGRLLFVDRGARVGTNGDTLLAIAADDPTAGVRLFIDTTGSAGGYYGITYHDGSSSVTARLESGQPTAGQLVELSWDWATNGALTLYQSINGAAATSATSSALAKVSAWSAGTKVRIGRRGLTQNPAPLTLLGLWLLPDAYNDTTLDEAA